MDWLSFISIDFIFFSAYLFLSKNKQTRQLTFIKSNYFNPSIKYAIYDKYQHLTNEQVHMVIHALRDYFWMCNIAKRNMVAMPSQVVDVALHEFILFTRNYQTFFKKGIDDFFTTRQRNPCEHPPGRGWH